MVVFGGTEILFPIHERDCVQHKMIMQMVCLIQMGGDYHLISFAPQASCQLNPNLMLDFGSSFTGSKGLVAVVGYGSILFTEAFFHSHHFRTGGSRMTVDTGNKAFQHIGILLVLCRLSAIHGIGNHIVQSLTFPLRHIPVFIKFRVGCLVGILHINHHLAQPAVDPPDGCDCHWLLLDGAWTYYSCGDLLHRSFKLGYGSIVPMDINYIQGMGFLSYLVQIVADAVELLHHGVVIRGRCILWNSAIDEMAHMDDAYIALNRHVFTLILDRFHISPSEQKYMMPFYIHGLMGIVNEWLKEDCRDSVEHIISVIQICITECK